MMPRQTKGGNLIPGYGRWRVLACWHFGSFWQAKWITSLSLKSGDAPLKTILILSGIIGFLVFESSRKARPALHLASSVLSLWLGKIILMKAIIDAARAAPDSKQYTP
jgi:hypothetical protein